MEPRAVLQDGVFDDFLENVDAIVHSDSNLSVSSDFNHGMLLAT